MALKTSLISFLWVFAEATFFFIVPDVWLTRVTIQDKKQAVRNVVYCTAGAVTGGVLIYCLALVYMADLVMFFDKLPAISEDMIKNANSDISESGFASALLGAVVQGVPYKIYAAWAAALKINILYFCIVSTCVRIVRFVIVTLITIGVCTILKNHTSLRFLYDLHIGVWIIFYIFYFAMQGL